MQFEKLDVWKRSARLASNIYKLMATCKDYGFKDQITRSALSIPSNIAEGMERETSKEEARFLYYAKGSSGELLTQTYIGVDIGYIDKSEGTKIITECKEISAMIAALIKIRKGFVREESEQYTVEPRT
ncbi:four helix bundle protein [Colwellia echini]|uniref:Four helix bundle protein n=1 Tax=Colwellia echini TaxID=1982103 RepID=A0ABY3MVV2_9GAMM|nr:four helix bundle protein [Colwellia echini]TYK65333.1 four helix bundle protein [Colwellia echini]